MKLRNLQRLNGSSSKELVVVCSVFIFSTCALLDAYLCFFVTSHPEGPTGVTLPIERNHSCFQPFCIINAKGLLLDPVNFYIHTPLSDILVSKFGLGGGDYFFKANFVSISHLPVALLAARFISRESLSNRRLGVLLFEVRNFLDSFDGSLARAGRRHDKNMLVQEGALAHLKINRHYYSNAGFYIDGICDGLGCVFLYLACLWYLRKHPPRRSLMSYSPLPPGAVTSSNNDLTSAKDSSVQVEEETPATPYYFSLKLRQLLRSVQMSGGIYVILFGIQTLLGSAMWNRYIATYTKILETPENMPEVPLVTSVRSGLLHSPMMWVVCYAWRYVNPHSLVEVLLIAIFFDKMYEVLYAVKWVGFLLLGTVFCFTEIHLYQCKEMLGSYVRF